MRAIARDSKDSENSGSIVDQFQDTAGDVLDGAESVVGLVRAEDHESKFRKLWLTPILG